MPDINTIPTLPRFEGVQRRFWAKVQKSDGCWLWTANKLKALPYGRMAVQRGWAELSHRLSYVFAFGRIEPGQQVLHQCDNPSCVRPDHLFLGTNAENVADKVAKGRASRMPGEKHPAAKLREADIPVIRRSQRSGVQLAAIYGVSTNTICRVRKGKIWRHIT